jgi:hypothetical protein
MWFQPLCNVIKSSVFSTTDIPIYVTSVWLSLKLVTRVTLGHLTLLGVTRRDESCLQRAHVTRKVTSYPLSHYCDICWEKNTRHQTDDVTVAGAKSWKMWQHRCGAPSISILIAFRKVGGGEITLMPSTNWVIHKMRKRDRKGTICVSGKVEKLLLLRFRYVCYGIRVRTVCVHFVSVGCIW